MGLNRTVVDFATEIGGGTDDVMVIGDESRLPAAPGVRTVSAPSGIVDFQPDEMTVRCGAGTPIAELLDLLGEHGQYVNLPSGTLGRGTVGGALAVGRTGTRRLGRGPVRDCLLQAVVVDHRGRPITAGGPTVKNVSGFDLARLLVGSYGVFGFLAEVILRTRPLPRASRWFSADLDAPDQMIEFFSGFYRPSAVLWNGRHAWVCLEGHPLDIDNEIVAAQRRGVHLNIDTEPDLSEFAHRWSARPVELGEIATREPGTRVVEVGVGVVHDRRPAPPPTVDPVAQSVTIRLLDEFNPNRRLNRAHLFRVR